jgi:hypothetical protein
MTTATAAPGTTVTARLELEEPRAIASPAPVSDARQLPASDAPSHGSRNAIVVVLGGTAAVALGLGIGFGVRSRELERDADGLRQRAAAEQPTRDPSSSCYGIGSETCAALRDTNADQRTAANIATALYIASGALAVGGVVAFLAWPKPKPVATSRLVPTIGQGSIGFHLQGQFW